MINALNSIDKRKTINRYTSRFNEFGFSPKTLGWAKGNQDVRFFALTHDLMLNNRNICDVGCGFGDLYDYTSKRNALNNYYGIDLVDKLVKKGRERHKNIKNFHVRCGDFLENNSYYETLKIDYFIMSGIFNFNLDKQNNYEYLFSVIETAFNISNAGVSFDFLNENADFQEELNFHYSPEKVLSFCYTLSRNVLLKSNYMPFETTITILKDDSFNKKSVFNTFLEG
jgi:hypothetical protein